MSSGATSVGIVADPAFHAFDGFNTLAKAKQWLREHEPQCAAILAADDDLIRDFRVMKNYSHGVTRIFDGEQRWCLTGDAGVFLDPLYSSGLDLVAIGNGLITDMVTRDLDGEDVAARARISDTLFRSLTDMWLAVYRDQYTLMGTPAVMSAKIIWDVAFYWGFIGLLYTNDRFVRIADEPGLRSPPRGPDRVEQPGATVLPGMGGHPGRQRPGAIRRPVQTAELHGHAAHRDDGGEPRISSGSSRPTRRLLRQVAGQLVETVLADKSAAFDDDAAVRQVQAWQRDPLLREIRAVYRDEQQANPVSSDWLATASPALQSS